MIPKAILSIAAIVLLVVLLGCQANCARAPSARAVSGLVGLQQASAELQLYLVVNPGGSIKEARIHKSSGSQTLDDYTLHWVRKHWKWPRADCERTFIVPFKFRLND